MPESPEELYARIVAQVGPEGRLPMSPVHDWESFPWEIVDGELVPKVIQAPIEAEAPRAGAGGQDCHICNDDGDAVKIWENWNFHVKRPAKPTGLPLMFWLNANEHYDFHELPDELAAEFGKISVWLCRIMCNMPNVGRVHISRWGDGSEHMHTWFVARPQRIPGIIGSMAIEWNEMLPPGPEELWLEECRTIAEKLAMHDGHTLPRPKRV